MKTAVSIPDSVYESAEKLAQRLGTTRSKLYSQALESYLSAQEEAMIIKQLNEYYAEATNGLDPVLQQLQDHSLSKNKDRW